MTKTTKIVLGIVGGLFLLCLIVVSYGFWMFRSAFQSEQVDSVKATAAFDEVRGRFTGVEPAFEMVDRRPVIRRPPPATAASPLPASVRILVWDRDEDRMSRISLPFSVLKLSNDPIEFEGVSLDVEDVQRYGRTLLLDGDTPDGDRILVWTD
jgi:hypothetical protein